MRVPPEVTQLLLQGTTSSAHIDSSRLTPFSRPPVESIRKNVWQPKSFVAILVVAPCVIELIDDLMEDLIKTMLLVPIVLIDPAIDVIDISMLRQTKIVI